jgi:hypothetical protein
MSDSRNDKARGQAGQGAQQVQRTSCNDTTPRRCVACLSPVPRHAYCRHCRAWLRFGHALRTMQAALREVRA